ncbi:MAG: delta-aminolevulinic acid dehydratase [Candidatus Riflebacteria bacterium GWC2_50_8]|nr:MAG: delta-aminolevulinic acid dehydratase [Candidatus Riflebacteria bacterium GWC2_50_8]
MSFPVHRPRRLRIDSRLRGMIRDVSLFAKNLIYPLFVVDGLAEPHEISAMPGQKHWPLARIHEPVADAMRKGVIAFLLFGVPASKDEYGSQAYDENSIVCRALRHIRQHCPQAYLITDVCLCAYTDHGHCGLVKADGVVDNDSSIDLIARMALAHAQAGADMVAPSDMMDGRIGAIRTLLDSNGFGDMPIMSYSAKYASAFYGPFREAAGSAPGKGDRSGYQMDYRFARDAMPEFELDLEEGADILMVKPGLAYLDMVKLARDSFSCPIAVYQVSGEYSMIKAAAEKGWVNERAVVLESLCAMRRAGADLILSYFAPQVAEWLKEEQA